MLLLLLLVLVIVVNGFRLGWYISPSSQVSAQASLIFMVFNCLYLFLAAKFIEIIFWLFQPIKSSESKVKFRHAGGQCIKVLEAAKLAYSYTTKTPSLPRNLALGTFGELPTVLSTKLNLLYLLYSTDWRCSLLHLIKQNCLLKTFLRNLTLMTQVSLYLFSLLKLIWNCIIFL